MIVSPRIGNNYGPHCLMFWYFIDSVEGILMVNEWNISAIVNPLVILEERGSWTRALVELDQYDNPPRVS